MWGIHEFCVATYLSVLWHLGPPSLTVSQGSGEAAAVLARHTQEDCSTHPGTSPSRAANIHRALGESLGWSQYEQSGTCLERLTLLPEKSGLGSIVVPAF